MSGPGSDAKTPRWAQTPTFWQAREGRGAHATTANPAKAPSGHCKALPSTPPAKRPLRPLKAGAWAFLFGTIAMVCLSAGIARAHPLSPAHVIIAPTFFEGPTDLDVTVTHAPDARAPNLSPPPNCTVTPVAARTAPDGDHIIVTRWRCPDLTGTVTLIAAPDDPPVIVESRGPTNTQTSLLDAATPTLFLADAFSPVSRFDERLTAWTLSGAVHLLIGLDHVLLVVGLVLLLGFTRRLVAALTAFTIGHSISLALGATGTLTLPSAPVETAIALTLVGLALALTRGPSATTRDPIVRAPWVVGLAIGLVHGLGFAGVLGELDLPTDGLALPILGFNVGLELAQLALVVAMAALLLPIRRFVPGAATRLNTPAGWAIGIIAAAWTIERVGG